MIRDDSHGHDPFNICLSKQWFTVDRIHITTESRGAQRQFPMCADPSHYGPDPTAGLDQMTVYSSSLGLWSATTADLHGWAMKWPTESKALTKHRPAPKSYRMHSYCKLAHKFYTSLELICFIIVTYKLCKHCCKHGKLLVLHQKIHLLRLRRILQ